MTGLIYSTGVSVNAQWAQNAENGRGRKKNIV